MFAVGLQLTCVIRQSCMMSIRTAVPSDDKAIAELHAASWQFAYRGALSDEYLAGDIVADRMALWQARLHRPEANQYVIVAHEKEVLLGFACLYLGADPLWGSLLDNIHVSQAAQRKGLGSLLLHAVANHCMAAAPHAGLHLWVLQQNIGAQQFYCSHGAENVGTDTWNAPGGTQVPRFLFGWPVTKIAQLLVADTSAQRTTTRLGCPSAAELRR